MSDKPFRLLSWQTFRRLPTILDLQLPDEGQQLARIRLMERNIGLPVKGAVILALVYYLFFSNWLQAMSLSSARGVLDTPHEIALETIRGFFIVYVVINAGISVLLLGMSQFSLRTVQQFVFLSSWIDALFLAVMTLITGGFDSFLYWVFLGLIIRNTWSVPSTPRQIILNLIATGSYILAGVFDVLVSRWEYEMSDEIARVALEGPAADQTEPFLLRVSLLVLMTVCCYGVQVLLEKQRRAEAEAREFSLRHEQLQATGRLAAEIAHQLKNPLGIINNAAFTLQRTMKEGKTITQQIKIIREEVERSDRILTELMGYARLSEGQVEKLDVTQELDSAVNQVFPPAAKYETRIVRHYSPALPPLLAQKAHISEVFMNLLQNAREAMNGQGEIEITARYAEPYSVVVTIGDNGPGIPEQLQAKIFDPYFTTKEKGTGLGLAIVKHNTELYNGTVRVESAPGRGTKFIVALPAKTVFNLKR